MTPLKILIVEDEVLVAEALAADLKDMGFRVADIACSAEECFAAFRRHAPDVILMDIRIKGGMDGIGAAKKLRGEAPVPVIFLTANTDPATMQAAIESGPRAFLSKPYNKKDLQAAIALAFSRHNREAPSETAAGPLTGSVFVRTGEQYRRLPLSEVHFVEAAGSYCTVHTENGRHTLSMNLQSFVKRVGERRFVRIHRSFLVNIEQVEGFDNYSVLVGGKQLPVSKSRREKVLGFFRKL